MPYSKEKILQNLPQEYVTTRGIPINNYIHVSQPQIHIHTTWYINMHGVDRDVQWRSFRNFDNPRWGYCRGIGFTSGNVTDQGLQPSCREGCDDGLHICMC